MSYNNEFILQALAADPHAPLSSVASTSQPPAQPHLPPRHGLVPRSPTFAHQLPNSHNLDQEAIRSSSLELTRQSLQLQREREIAEALAEEERLERRKELKESQGTWTSLIVGKRKGADKSGAGGAGDGKGKSKGFDRPPQAYELYAAIDKKDLNYIARVRDHAFPLLLQKNAGEFPIIYASRIGQSHKDIVILLCGAFSRYVNHLEDEDFQTQKKEIISVLRALRVNLKLAIDNSLLPAFDSSLLSSYLQVLIMSEGDIWIHKAVHEVALWLRTWEVQPGDTKPPIELERSPDMNAGDIGYSVRRTTGNKTAEVKPFKQGPVHKAESLIMAFCTKELKNVPLRSGKEGGLGVEEYVANSTMDLVLMAAWMILGESVPGGLQGLPTYTFARDLRTYSLFIEHLEEHRFAVQPKLLQNKRLKRQIDLLVDVCGDTRIGIKGRVEILRERLDGR